MVALFGFLGLFSLQIQSLESCKLRTEGEVFLKETRFGFLFITHEVPLAQRATRRANELFCRFIHPPHHPSTPTPCGTTSPNRLFVTLKKRCSIDNYLISVFWRKEEDKGGVYASHPEFCNPA